MLGIKDFKDSPFQKALTKTFSAIKEEKAAIITTGLYQATNRKIDDLVAKVNQIELSKRGDLIALCPNSFGSTKVADGFDPDTFIKEQIEVGCQLHDIKIELGILLKFYEENFGKHPSHDELTAFCAS